MTIWCLYMGFPFFERVALGVSSQKSLGDINLGVVS